MTTTNYLPNLSQFSRVLRPGELTSWDHAAFQCGACSADVETGALFGEGEGEGEGENGMMIVVRPVRGWSFGFDSARGHWEALCDACAQENVRAMFSGLGWKVAEPEIPRKRAAIVEEIRKNRKVAARWNDTRKR